MATPSADRRARHARKRGLRVRYERVTAALSACGVTLVAVLGGAGLLPSAAASPRLVAHTDALVGALSGADMRDAMLTALPGPLVVAEGARFQRSDAASRRVARAALRVPSGSGEGRRVVFDQTAQRVWLVGGSGDVRRTYLVSGSVDDNLDPGSYEVFSRSERAWGIDDGGTMRFMVRFAHGERAAIGFHDIPYKDGERVQSRSQLGTALSSGCVRQWRPDARALWEFAPVGTPVVVVA